MPGPNFTKSNPLSGLLPYDPRDYAQALGQKGEGTMLDWLLQRGVEHAPEILGARGLWKRLPISKAGGAKKLAKLEKLSMEPGFPKLSVNPESIYQSEKYLPKTHATREMLSEAASGNYKNTFGLQSQMGKHERDLVKSPLASERLIAPEVRDLRQDIIKQMDESLRTKGHHDIADLLKGGLKDYRTYIKFRDALNPILKTLKIPTSILAVLGIGTKKGRNTIKSLID